MIKEGVGYTSNSFDTLTNLKGERIKGVVKHYDNGMSHWILIFDSGFGLEVGSNGTFWIVVQKEMTAILDRKKNELKTTVEQLDYVLTLAGEMKE
jgi:hypothetical protein